MTETVNYVPYQLCPKCQGQGIVSKPPYIAGDIDQWTDSSSSHSCDVCNGAKIIPMFQSNSVVRSLGVATTIGELKKLIENYTDQTSFGFRNQPMQELHEVIYTDAVYIVFQ